MADDRYNSEELQMRLDRTICRYKGHPYWVLVGNMSSREARDRYPWVSLYRLGDGYRPSHVIDHRDPEFDDSAPQLGYLNMDSTAHYLKRMPLRWAAQGLRGESIESIPRIVTNSRSEWCNSQSMEACILGRYPKITDALSWLSTQRTSSSRAVHRDIAVSNLDSQRVGLHYKGRLVAQKGYNLTDWSFFDGADKNIIISLIKKAGVL